MSHKKLIKFIPWRYYVTLFLIGFAVVCLACRIIQLAVFKQPFLRHQGDQRMLRLVSTPAFRGMIKDRNGYPLAVSSSVYSIWVNPKSFSPSPKKLKALAAILDVPASKIKSIQKAYIKKKREFAYLKRGLTPGAAYKVRLLAIRGLHVTENYRRFYPEAEVTSQLVGFTNIDDRGQEGLELAYNDWLMGTQGKAWVIKDRLGRIISNVKTIQKQKAGNDLTLSVDRRIQYLAYRELLNAVTKANAASGSAVVLDVETGEVLAMVNQPSFNPNKPSGRLGGHIRNRAITDVFEPGSTMKAFSVATAIASGKYHATTEIDTSPGWMRVGHNVVRDEHNNGVLTVEQIIQKSSNMGVTKMMLDVPGDQLWTLFHDVGFGEMTGIEFPGEQEGSLEKHNPWGDFTKATLSFGYGVSVTTLQLAKAYAVLARFGEQYPVFLLKDHKPGQAKRVMSKAVAKEMVALLESVVSKKGTGRFARVTGYRVAGKTGTANIAKDGGYEKKRYVSSFVGFAPISKPRLVVAVVVNDPKTKFHTGGWVSAPAFSNIMRGALTLLNVDPDGFDDSITKKPV